MSTDQTLRTALMSSSKFDACQGLRVDDAWDRSDLVDNDLTEDVEVFGLDLRDQVVFSEQGWSSTISFTLRSSLYTSCSFAGAVLMSTNPMAIPRSPRGETTVAI